MAIAAVGIDTSVSAPIIITAPGSDNTKGDWTEIEDSTTIDATGLILSIFITTANGDVLLDVGTGAAASETVLVENIPIARQTGIADTLYQIVLPIAIASGTRLSLRYQGGLSTIVMRAGGWLIKKDNVGFDECTSAVTYGTVTADSGGTEVDPGASTQTKGVYSELTSSTSADIKWLQVNIGNRSNSARTSAFFLVDIATGAASSESVVIPNLCFLASTSTDVMSPQQYPPIPIEISSGTRLAARAQSGTNDATDRLIDVSVIGYNGTASGGSGGGGGFSAWMG